MRASGPAVIRNLAVFGLDPRTCHKKAQRPFPGETRSRKCGLGQIWVILLRKAGFAIGRIRAFSEVCMKTLEIGSMAVQGSRRKGFGNWLETGRKWAYFKLLPAGPWVVLD
jgi:hypothetical protein